MDLKLNNLEAVAVMNALQHYVKALEKMGNAVVFDNQMGASDAADPITPVGVGSSIVIRK